MTTRDVLKKWTPPRGSYAAVLEELSDDPKMRAKEFGSWSRWLGLQRRIAERRVAIRAAARRYARTHPPYTMVGR